jgi:hypothetical protein
MLQQAEKMMIAKPTETRMRMRYGVNHADECWDFAIGPERAFIRDQLRAIDTHMIRLFAFDKGAPDPVTDWKTFAAYTQAVLDAGAVPMITFAKFRQTLDDPRAIRWFAEQSADIVWSCIEQWGPERVRDWYWCVWNEPNSTWIGGGLSFDMYRRIYETVAERVMRYLEPCLNGRKALVGGPSVEGFQPFWMDWVWRFVNEIDNSLIGFIDWHSYGDWREHGESNAPRDPKVHRAMMMGLVPDYGSRARAIGQMIKGRDMLNICGELNCHSHYWTEPRQRFNHSIFGATFYIASLLHLMRAGVDQEMFWTGTEDQGGYGMMGRHGEPRPAFLAKKLCAEHVRPGDWISFPTGETEQGGFDVVISRGHDGRNSAVIVHLKEETQTFDLSKCKALLDDCRTLLKLDEGTNHQIAQSDWDGSIHFQGFGVAVVTNQDPAERL